MYLVNLKESQGAKCHSPLSAFSETIPSCNSLFYFLNTSHTSPSCSPINGLVLFLHYIFSLSAYVITRKIDPEEECGVTRHSGELKRSKEKKREKRRKNQ